MTSVPNKKKVGICLSGGGFRGVGHIGVLKALDSFGLKADVLSGTSAGAIIACFYAKGFAPEEMLKLARNTEFFSPRNIGIRLGKNWFGQEIFSRLYANYFPEDSLENLPIKVIIATTDITAARVAYFEKGSINSLLLASACLPVLFKPILYQNHLFLDGGLSNNLPIEPLQDQCDFLIGSHVNALQTMGEGLQKQSLVLDRAYHVMINHSVYTKSGQCDLFIDPPEMTRFSIFDRKLCDEIFGYCYDYTMRYLEQKQPFL